MRIATGTYAGDAADNRYISGVGFQPDVVLVKSAGAGSYAMRMRIMPALISVNSSGMALDDIQELRPDGFVVGTSTRVNGAATTYYYLALQCDPRDATLLTYTGDGLDSRAMTGVGFTPDFVLTVGYSTQPVFRTSSIAGDFTAHFDAPTANQADHIQSLDSDGFTLGTESRANENGTIFTPCA